MTPEHIVNHLSYVLTEEQVPFEEPALWLLARAADGSMRDALSLTDQAIAFGNQTLSRADVGSMLGTIDQRSTQQLVACLVGNDGPGLLGEIQRISEFAPDYSVILEDLLSLFHRVTMEQVVPGSVDNALGDAAQVKTLARQLSAEDAQLFYQTALIGRKDLEVTPDARMGFEMTLLRMLAFRPGSDRRAPPATARSAPAAAGSEEPEPGPAPQAPARPPVQPEAPAPAPEPEPPSAPPARSESEAPSRPSVDAVPEPAAAPPAGDEFDWQRDYRSLGIVGMPGNLASQAAMTVEGDEITLTLGEGHIRLLTDRHREKILAGLQRQFGDGVTLQIVQGDPGDRTPAAWEENQRRQRQEAAVRAIQNDPVVASIVERFEGRVVEDSIRPC
jgi:DNA polymerase-3 subunit gamma/tau